MLGKKQSIHYRISRSGPTGLFAREAWSTTAVFAQENASSRATIRAEPKDGGIQNECIIQLR